MSTEKPPQVWRDGELPFPRRWVWYIALKIVVLAAIVYGILRWRGLV